MKRRDDGSRYSVITLALIGFAALCFHAFDKDHAMPPTVLTKSTYEMPRPPAIVVWRHAPGGESSYAIVTKYGKSAISLLIFPSESRVGVPKDGVRHISDPALKGQANSDAGVWEFTEDTLLLRSIVGIDKVIADTKTAVK